MELFKCQDVSIGLDSFFTFSNGVSYVHHSLFSQGCSYLLCTQRQLPTPDNSFGSVESFMWVALYFCCMKSFSFLMFSACLQMSSSKSRFPFLVFLTFWGVSSCFHNFFYEEREELHQADILQRFNDNESEEVCCISLRV